MFAGPRHSKIKQITLKSLAWKMFLQDLALLIERAAFGVGKNRIFFDLDRELLLKQSGYKYGFVFFLPG